MVCIAHEAFGSLNATTKVPRAFPLKLNMGADCTDWMPRLRYTRRHPASKRVSVEMFGHVTRFPSHTPPECMFRLGWRNRASTQPAHKRVRQARKKNPVECSRGAVNDGATHDCGGRLGASCKNSSTALRKRQALLTRGWRINTPTT
jgi:hypothetical protein